MTKVIPISAIAIPESRQRTEFPEVHMQELSQSISGVRGLIAPIMVRVNPKVEGAYILVAGERRLRVISEFTESYLHGQQTIPPGHIPAVVTDFDDIDAAEAELHENIVRLDLGWKDKVEAIAMLHKMKLKANPNHTAGMTAARIESADSETKEKTGYASGGTYKRVNTSLLVAEFLDRKEVAAAGSLNDAAKVVSRIIEADTMERLKKMQVKEAAPKSSLPVLNSVAPDLQEQGSDVLPALDLLQASPKHEFYHGDMQKLILDIPAHSINLVITDPPYGQDVESFGDMGKSILAHNYSEDNWQELYRTLITELDRICAESAHVYIFCDIDHFVEIKAMFSDKWRVRRKPIVWDKSPAGALADGTPQGYRTSHEIIIYANRGGRPCSAVISDVLRVSVVKQKIHAAQKPTELYSQLMKMSALPGDVVFDPFAGSGTIYYAANEHFIRAIGFEMNDLNASYCELAMQGKQVSEDDIPF